MAGVFKERMQAARRQLHDVKCEDALIMSWPLGATIPKNISVRILEKFVVPEVFGSDDYARMRDSTPRAIMLRAEVGDSPRRGLLISTSTGKWLIDQVDPPDGITVTAYLTRAVGAQYEGVPKGFAIGGESNFPNFAVNGELL